MSAPLHPQAAQTRPITGLGPPHPQLLSTVPGSAPAGLWALSIMATSVPRPSGRAGESRLPGHCPSSPFPSPSRQAPAACPALCWVGSQQGARPCSASRFMPSWRVGGGLGHPPLLSHPPGPPGGSGSLGRRGRRCGTTPPRGPPGWRRLGGGGAWGGGGSTCVTGPHGASCFSVLSVSLRSFPSGHAAGGNPGPGQPDPAPGQQDRGRPRAGPGPGGAGWCPRGS